MELNIIFPNTTFIKIKKEDLEKNMNYFTIKRSDYCVYIFIDQCKQIGNIYTFIRIKSFILCKDKKEFNLDYDTKLINEEISIGSSYFDKVELYKMIKIHDL